METVLLPSTYKRSGFTHTMVKRGEFGFVFAVADEDGKPISFEVFKKLISKAGMAKFGGGPEIFVPAKERKPNDEAFGKWAWCYINEDKAIEYFNKLESVSGDLRAFLELKSPNPLLKVYELHDRNGKPLSMKIMGKTTNRTIKVGSPDEAKEAFARMLSANFDMKGWTPVLIGEEYKYGKTEDEDSSEDEDENSNEE